MAYRWHQNRDSGSVRSHRNPDTRRRFPLHKSERMGSLHKPYRRLVHAMLDNLDIELTYEGYTLLIPKIVREWDFDIWHGKVRDIYA